MRLPEPETLFLDTFEDPAFAPRWEELDLSSLQGPAQWSVQRGLLRQTSNCYTPNSYRGTMLLARASAEPPYRVQARLRSMDPDRMGLIFGCTDPENLHLFWMSEALRDRALVSVQRGRESRVAASRTGFQLSRWYDLDLLVTRRQITLLIDGEPALDAPAEAPLSGRAGLYAHANQALEVSEFVLTRPVGAPRRPLHLQWQVRERPALSTHIYLSNTSDLPVWVRAEALDSSGAPVACNHPNPNAWQRLDPGCSGTISLSAPQTRPGYGLCNLYWRTPEPLPASPILASAQLLDERGGGLSVPIL